MSNFNKIPGSLVSLGSKNPFFTSFSNIPASTNAGMIVFTGLTSGESYTISYLDDGVLVPDTVYVADANGDIYITGLDSGTYTNITISFSGCSTTVDTELILVDPPLPNYTVSTEDFTNCDAVDGKLIFAGLTPNTIYTLT